MYTDMKTPFQGYVGGGIGQQSMAGAAMQQASGLSGSFIGEAAKITDTKRPELAEYMERHANTLSYTEELVQTLEKRLSMVSAPAAPTTGDKGCATQGAITYYGQQVQAGIERLSVVNATLRNMLDRLEA